jgi:poly(3-hydroxybutyrate) depolymerase
MYNVPQCARLALPPSTNETIDMLYPTYEARRALSAPLYNLAAAQAMTLRSLPAQVQRSRWGRTLRAISETTGALQLTHVRPNFKIETVQIDGQDVPVQEEVVTRTPFGSLLRFAKDVDLDQPRVLLVPGLAGHFATLIRDTVKTFLPDHDVYVADWHNARDIPTRDGRFGLDEYIGHLIDFLAAIGPGGHLVAVCQPCPTALAAASIMAQDEHEAEPRSLVLMAGPVDARINPGPVDQFAARTPVELLERAVIARVPWPYAGAGRRVYPGFLQATGFMALAPRRHLSAFVDMMRDLGAGNDDDASRTLDFYEEYFAVLDVSAEFYLETARTIFQDHDLPRGRMRWRQRQVEPAAIKSALFTVEAQNDTMCPPGQTRAAQDVCTGIPESRKRHLLQPGVGHYGIFSGTRFEQEVYPEIRAFIGEAEAAA